METKHIRYNLPPSPARALPVIGHLHLLKLPLHRTFLSLSQSLGGAPISASAWKTNSRMSSPPTLLLANSTYNYTSMVSAPYGDHWRNLRRLGTIEIFSSHRLNSYLSIRKDKIRHLILRHSKNSQHLNPPCLSVCICYRHKIKLRITICDSMIKIIKEFVKVEMRTLFVDFILNNVMRMVAGKRFYGDGTEHDDDARCVRQLMAEVVDCAGAGDVAEYFPDLLTRNMREKKGNTMIDRLLSLQDNQPDYCTDHVVIKGIFVVMILSGTDTLTGTLE
ncbi:hypothetical protein Bca52824_084544 [Brassica carinata]|uniref:Uncharacterized protein n=1 Tax=Brassica carinata TaxID=52824 RepID=A0A8X7PPA4_BRACI|nr:hypothetical protein Bca52824_084544 [Brassica carinata]